MYTQFEVEFSPISAMTTRKSGVDGGLRAGFDAHDIQNSLTTFNFNDYDKNGRIKERITTRDIPDAWAYLKETFDYDANGQLLRVNITSGADEASATPTDLDSYAYDDAGNRISGSVLDEEVDYTTGPENRLLEDSDFDYTYDDQGRLTSKAAKDASHTIIYTWDHRGLLLKAARTGADPYTVEYGYDVTGRRTARKVGADTTITHYDGQNRLAEFDSVGIITRHYLNGLGPNEVLAVDQGGATAWAHSDQLGSVVMWGTFDGTDWSLQHQSFDAFGNLEMSTTALSVGGETLPQIWAGHQFEVEIGLYHMQARWYDPRTGEFISHDPSWFSAGDANLDRYAGNDPVNSIDPD